MTTVTEADLELTFAGAKAVIHFDDDTYHAGNTIKRVDFIVEYDDRHVFVEIKDPDIPAAINPAAFVEKLKSGELIQSLAGKFRDTLFFRSAQGKSNIDIPVSYLVLLSMSSLESALLVSKQDELKRSIPIRHQHWKFDCAANCIILNFDHWRRNFGDNSIRRISDGGG